MPLTTTEWIIITGVLAVTLAGGLWAVRRAGMPGELRDHFITFLWAFAAVYGLIFGVGYLYFGRTVLGLHWLAVTAIAWFAITGWMDRKNAPRPPKSARNPD